MATDKATLAAIDLLVTVAHERDALRVEVAELRTRLASTGTLLHDALSTLDRCTCGAR